MSLFLSKLAHSWQINNKEIKHMSIIFDLFDALVLKLFGKYLVSDDQAELYQAVNKYLERSHKEMADIFSRL